jgi:hypothetical protein
VTGIFKWEGVVTAQSSVAHGAEALGTITYLRRERFLTLDGKTIEVPVISGNAWRGLLRDTAADLWWKAAGSVPLTLPVMHAVWSGGALAKMSGSPLTGSRLVEVKQACPVVGVFGTAGGGRIVSGALQVGKMLPICQETAHLLPEHLREDDLPSMWDLTQIEYYSRIPNVGMEAVLEDGVMNDDPDALLARYGVETFVAGTRFYTWISLTWPTPEELSFFAEALASYSADARVGGLLRAGHGRLVLNLQAPTTASLPADWRATVQNFQVPRLLEVMSWLD